jgi:hypothetical protein
MSKIRLAAMRMHFVEIICATVEIKSGSLINQVLCGTITIL